MTTKRATRIRKAGHGTGQRSVKTDGFIVQSVRMTVNDNNLVRKASELAGLSLNGWAAAALTKAAKAVVDKDKADKAARRAAKKVGE